MKALLLIITWTLGMSTEAARRKCPKPFVPMYQMLHEAKYYACDDGKNTTVLVFSSDKLVAIMDLRFFAKTEGK
jgi:hypothetical protein